MASAGTVNVEFAAEVARFNAQLASVNKSLKAVESNFASVERAAGVALRVFSGAALLAFSKSVFTAADRISDAAKRAGIAVDSFSRLQFAAEQADVEFSELTTGLRQFQTNMSEAQDGVASATRTFNLLGVQAQKIAGLPLEQQLGEIADAFQNIVDPADRVRIATELFGRSGQNLIPLLAEGADGIQKLTAEADRLGITMSDVTAKGIDQADAAIKRLNATVLSGGSKFLAGLSLFLLGPPDEAQKLDQQILELVRQRDLVLARVPDTSAREKRIDAINAKIAELIAKQKELIGLGDNLILPKIDVDVGEISVTPDISALQEEFDKAQQKIADAALDAHIRRIQEEHRIRLEDLDFRRQIEEAATESIRQGAEKQLAIAIESETRRFDAIVQAEEQIQAVRQGAMEAGLGLLRVLASRSKTAALALIAVNRGLQIAQAIQNTAAAVTKTLAIYGATPAGFAAAAGVKAIGAAQVALIAATGFVEGRSAISSGGLQLGSPHNPVFTQTPDGEEPTFGASSRSVTQVIFNGPVADKDVFLELIREAVDDRDVIVISPNSLQAQLIRGD